MNDEPGVSAEEMIARMSRPLSLRRRMASVGALLAGLTGAIFVASLWLTEPGPLPGRTHVAFALLTLLCLMWVGYGSWAITRRGPLFALDRLIAGWLSLAASATTTATMVSIVAVRGTGPLLAAACAVGAALVTAAAVLTAAAHRRRAALLRRKRELIEQRDAG